MSMSLQAMTPSEVAKVSRLEKNLLDFPQVHIQTTHHFHAGLYARTVRIPKGVVATGALIAIATLLIVSGDVTISIGTGTRQLTGYHIIPGAAGRKQTVLAHEDTDITMIFASTATTVEEAEAEFTDEGDLLMSRKHDNNDITIRMEGTKCLDTPQQ